jgi:hypothetical protein
MVYAATPIFLEPSSRRKKKLGILMKSSVRISCRILLRCTKVKFNPAHVTRQAKPPGSIFNLSTPTSGEWTEWEKTKTQQPPPT